MQSIRALSLPQRVVVVVGFAAAMATGALWWVSGNLASPERLLPRGPLGDLAGEYLLRPQGRDWSNLLVPLALVVVWTAGSVWFLGLDADVDDDVEDD